MESKIPAKGIALQAGRRAPKLTSGFWMDAKAAEAGEKLKRKKYNIVIRFKAIFLFFREQGTVCNLSSREQNYRRNVKFNWGKRFSLIDYIG